MIYLIHLIKKNTTLPIKITTPIIPIKMIPIKTLNNTINNQANNMNGNCTNNTLNIPQVFKKENVVIDKGILKIESTLIIGKRHEN